MTSPEQSKLLSPAAPHTYGLPSSAIASPTTPPYCAGGAAGIRASTGLDSVESIESVKLPALSSAAAVRDVEAARCCAASLGFGLGAKLCLPARFLGLQLPDLALDPRQHLLTLCKLALDRPLRRGPLRH